MMSKIMIVTGTILIVVGIALRYGLLDWFGNLPGDIKYQSENGLFFFPVSSMIVISIVLSILLWLWGR